MALELISFGLGPNWIAKLYKKLKGIQHKRKTELSRINDVLNSDPLELAKFYVEPDCQNINPADHYDETPKTSREPIFKKIDEFLRVKKCDEPGDRHMFILSDAGMGKTSLLAMLKLLHLISFWPKNIDCILLKLGKNSIDEIADIENKRQTFLLLDALDEDRLAHGQIQKRLSDILDTTKSFYRVIITCRTQFFPKSEKEPFERPGVISVAGYVCPAKYLSLFDDKKVDKYLSKLFPRKYLLFKQEDKIRKSEELISKMGSLRCRPMLLANIDKLMESPIIKSEVNEYNIYRALVDNWLIREERKTKIPKNELLNACKILAVEMQKRNVLDIPESDLNLMIADISDLEKVKAIDIRGRSLLNKNSEGDYRFSHHSIQEFLVIRYFVETTRAKPKNKLPVTERIAQMSLDIGKFVACQDFFDFSEVRLNNLNLLRKNLEKADLKDANLERANLERANLERVNLYKADLKGANLERANLERANLKEANLKGASIKMAILKNTNLQRVNLSGANLYEADLKGADLNGAILEGTNLHYVKGLTEEMLLGVYTLHKVKKLDSKLDMELKKKKPELFESRNLKDKSSKSQEWDDKERHDLFYSGRQD